MPPPYQSVYTIDTSVLDGPKAETAAIAQVMQVVNDHLMTTGGDETIVIVTLKTEDRLRVSDLVHGWFANNTKDQTGCERELQLQCRDRLQFRDFGRTVTIEFPPWNNEALRGFMPTLLIQLFIRAPVDERGVFQPCVQPLMMLPKCKSVLIRYDTDPVLPTWENQGLGPDNLGAVNHKVRNDRATDVL